MELERIREFATRLESSVGRVVLGQPEALRLMTIALLSEGHILIEGVPGIAKTLLARCFSASLALDFKRIQFTPDLMPGDVIGTNIFNFQTHEFVLNKGPIFTDVLLADEINRTPPKTQAALLQAMQERTVTIDGTTHHLGRGFLVIATQNPIEQQGTYPLPEAQLDRFLFKVLIDYPEREDERRMILDHGNRSTALSPEALGIAPVADLAFIEEARETVGRLRLSEEIADYILDIVRATRESTAVLCGASPRSANMLAVASRAHAALEGRDFVIPDDVKRLALAALRHRLPLAPGAEIEGINAESIVAQVLDQAAAPR